MRPLFDRSLLVAALMLAITAGLPAAERPLPVSGHDFRAADWGMSSDEVRRSEPAAPSLGDGPLLAFPAEVGGHPCQVIYLFQTNRLCMGFYLWSDIHDDLAAYFDDAAALRDVLAVAWQEPQIEKWDWEDPMFRDDPEMRAEALGLGLVRYELGWMTDDSIVALRMSGGNLEGDILLMYADRTCFPSGQEAFRSFFSDRIGLPSPYYR
jgi:hypothetical protein